ncbi:alpha-amylase family glycosyl hydrolase [Pontiella sp.]|uniref:alpha-amylase family glycosyl hydrolase n=1 Tax=Pontiella sp. TaxID=2837462 RepID=UPI00356792D2
MGDFYQHGVVTTLHQLSDRPIEAIEQELVEFGKQRPMALLLPSLFSELEGPALSNIVDELVHVPYLEQIIVGLDRADEAQYRHALGFFNRLPQRPNVMWHDGPRLREIDALLQEKRLAPNRPGKGRNVWYMFGYILATGKAQAVALHDCDITTYRRDLLARLIYPVANPAFSYKFCKGFYARVANNTLNGRACRLLVSPLIRALKLVCGPNPYLGYLDSFRYALAGEFAMGRDVIENIRIPSDWGLEMGVLSEIYRNYATNQICQVDVADIYDHKHQDLSAEDQTKGLSKMSGDIAKSLFRKMATMGEVFSAGKIRTIKATYYRIALDLVDSYSADATLNGLQYDRHKEGSSVELFAENIMNAGHEFLERSMETPFMPSWKRVIAGVPDVLDRLVQAVEADTQEFGSREVTVPSLHPHALRLRSRIEQHVQQIYADHDAGELSDRILVESGLESKTVAIPENIDKWSQNDVVAIGYGDSVIDDTSERPISPLANLHRFLDRELRSTVTGVHILPFSPFSSDDGFSVIDYTKINPALGTWEDLEGIAKNYVLMADLVLNHCSSQSLWFKNFREGKHPGKDYFIVPDQSMDLSQVVRPRSTPLLTAVETFDGEKQVWCTFGPDQVDLDFSNPEVLLEMIGIMAMYAKRGVRFFRLDAVAFLWKESGSPCVHLRQTHEIIKLLRLLLEHINPSIVVITETNVPNRENLSYFGNGNEAHMIYNFSLPPLLVNTLLTGNSRHLQSWMMSMPPAKRGRAYFNFISSHDGIGVRPAEGLLGETEMEDLLKTLQASGGAISTRRTPDGREIPYEVNISLFDAFKTTVAGAENAERDSSGRLVGDRYQCDRFLCAHTIMLALEGVPGIYLNSMLATPNDYALYQRTGRARSINRHPWSNSELNAALADPSGPHAVVFNEMKRLIQLRRQQPAFHPNATQYTLHLGPSFFAFWRESIDRDQSIFAIHNVSGEKQQLPLVELNLITTEHWRDLLSGHRYEDLESTIEFEPYASVWLSNR